MKVKIKRLTAKVYGELVAQLGENAEHVMIPSTVTGCSFEGVFTNAFKTEIAVPWPIDRPGHAQQVFADEHCGGGWPVSAVEIVRRNNTTLSVVK